MRERVDSIIGHGSSQVWVSTFHSTCVRILHRYIDRIGYDNNFTIYDTDDQKTVIKPSQLKKEYKAAVLLWHRLLLLFQFGAPAPAAVSAEASQAKAVSDAPKGTPITSPMVGAFYAAPSPGSEPYVKVGDVVKAGQVVCIVEAMKLMNEIESEVSGKVVQICVEDGQSVEYGQVLMYVE